MTTTAPNTESRALRLWPFLILFSLFSFSYCVYLLGSETVSTLTGEDGFFEMSGAFFYLLASAMFLGAYSSSGTVYFRAAGGVRRNIFLLLLAALCLFAFLEEVSWGQRFLGVQTPEALEEYNLQRETNVHNLLWFEGKRKGGEEVAPARWISGERLFNLFWLGYFVCIPLAARLWSTCSRIAGRLRLPLVPLGFSLLFVVQYVESRALHWLLGAKAVKITEIAEANVALLFLGVAIHVLVGESSRKKARNAIERLSGIQEPSL